MKKGDPIPTRFEQEEEEALEKIAERTGLSVSEIVRRSVRLMWREFRTRKNARWILDLVRPPDSK